MKLFYDKPLIAVLCVLIAVSNASAQQPAPSNVSGKVIDETSKPLDYATVSLLKAADSSLVKTDLTSETGTFSFNGLKPGRYILSSMMMGYRKTMTEALELKEGSSMIKNIVLTSELKNLQEVSVIAQKPFIERKMDKLVVNVENSSVSAGSTAMEVLEKAPGITVDKDDNISMKGKQGVLIMLDGKPTYMSSADVANMLRNMASDQIETIELITSPSARYDASGTSGIINIKTKKNRNMGLNGTFTAGTGYGKTSKYNGGTTLNFRKNKVNVFGNYNYANQGRLSNLNMHRNVSYLDTLTNFVQLNDWDNRRGSNSFKGGIDLFINKNHTVGVLVNGYANQNVSQSTSLTSRGNNFNQSETIRVAGDNTEKYSNTAYNFNYKGILDTNGRELSLDLDYSDYNGNMDEIRINSYTRVNLDPRNALTVKNYAPSSINVSSAKLDYTHPVNKSTKWETGLKVTKVKTDNDLLFAKQSGNVFIPDPEYTNHFLYNEDIFAGYINFSKEFKTTGIQFGLRAEQTDSKGNSITKNEIVERSYLELFPSVSVSQKLGKNHQLGLSFSRRIDRPDYDDLNPFLNFLDEYTYQKGNPYLNPQFTSSFDLSHTYKGGITTSLNYSHTRDVMTTVTEQDDQTQRTFAIERNLDEQEIMGISVFAPVPLAKWWNINNNLQVFNMKFKLRSTGEDLNSSQVSATYNMDHAFTISKTFTAEASVQYQSPIQYGVFKIQSQTVFNAGLRKSFMDNKANIRLSISDVFDTRKQRLSTTFQNMDLRFTEKGETQVARLTLNYRFGNNKVKAARNRSTGLEDEAGRMKQ